MAAYYNQAPGRLVPGDQSGPSSSYQASTGFVKTSKRQYLMPASLPPIEQDFMSSLEGIDTFRKFICNILVTRGKIKEKEALYYTENLELFSRALTHDSVNPTLLSDNYEILEHLGDETVNKSCTWYLKSRFPEIVARGDPGVKILSLQRSILKSKEKLALYSQRIGLTNFIRYRKLQFEYIKESGEVKTSKTKPRDIKTIVMDRSMKEDVLEAFLAAVEETIDNREKLIGIGYSVAYKIISSIFDEEQISIHQYDLVDLKTQLKELFDRRRSWGDSEVYSKTTPDNPNVTLTITLKVPPIGKSNVKSPIVKVFGPKSTIVKSGNIDEEFETTTSRIHLQLATEALKWLQDNYGEEFVRYRPGQ